jgi:hypothetical protein
MARSTDPLLPSPVAIPAWWTSGEAQIRAFIDERVTRGEARTLSTSPGGHPVRAALYGEAEPGLRGTANRNSALGAGLPEAFLRREERQHPVLMVLAGTHGQEMEGMVAALSLLSVMETGEDLAGAPQPELRAALEPLRVVVIPCANPDGRARCPYGGWVGLPTAEMSKWGQGTRRDGSPYGWPGCKAVHPMAGDVGILGAYFDDAGVNLMHDAWHAPMSETTAALLRLVADEAPDLLLNLHGHASPPMVCETAYVPLGVKRRVAAYAEHLYARLEAASLAHQSVPPAAPDGEGDGPPPALNLTSMAWHTGAALSLTFETPQGLSGGRLPFDYPAILRLHHVLFAAAAEWLRGG